MIALPNSSCKLQAKIGGAATTVNPVSVATYHDVTDSQGQKDRYGTQDEILTGATEVDIVDVAPRDAKRVIDSVSIHNQDSVAQTVTVQYYDGTDTRTVIKVSLDTLETLIYTANSGWHVLKSNGSVKSAADPTGGFADNVTLKFGDANDITMGWDGSDFDVLQATVDSSIKWGVDGDGIDHVFYGATASTSMTWDQSADSLIFTGAARIVWTGTTGQPEMHLTDNLADALSIEISGSTDLMVFTTTNNAESVAIHGLRTKGTTAVAITGATALTLADSGGIFTVGQGSAYDIDLPSPTSGPGCRYFFSLTAPGANAVTITVLGGAATFVGSIISEGQIIVATGATLTFASGVCVLGDSIEIQSIATNLYHVRAVSSILNGITIA